MFVLVMTFFFFPSQLGGPDVLFLLIIDSFSTCSFLYEEWRILEPARFFFYIFIMGFGRGGSSLVLVGRRYWYRLQRELNPISSNAGPKTCLCFQLTRITLKSAAACLNNKAHQSKVPCHAIAFQITGAKFLPAMLHVSNCSVCSRMFS